MPDWTRVRDTETGHEYTVATDCVLPGVHQVLDGKDAVDSGGRVLPAKPNRPLTSLTNVEGTPLSKMTADQLREYASTHQIDLGEASNKADVLAVIAAHEQGDPTPAA